MKRKFLAAFIGIALSCTQNVSCGEMIPDVKVIGFLGVKAVVTVGAMVGREYLKKYVNSDPADPTRFERTERIVVPAICAGIVSPVLYYANKNREKCKEVCKNIVTGIKKMSLSDLIRTGSYSAVSYITLYASMTVAQQYGLLPPQ